MKRLVSAVLITAASVLAIPSLATGEPHLTTTINGKRIVVRVYDPVRHDYHYWNRSEQAAYREYLAERHRAFVTYQRQRAAERRAYWHWRHEREERLEHERR